MCIIFKRNRFLCGKDTYESKTDLYVLYIKKTYMYSKEIYMYAKEAYVYSKKDQLEFKRDL